VAADTGVLEDLPEISQGLYGAPPKAVAAREIGGNAGRFTSRPNSDGTGRDYFITYDKNLPPIKVPRVQAHEISHGIDLFPRMVKPQQDVAWGDESGGGNGSWLL